MSKPVEQELLDNAILKLATSDEGQRFIYHLLDLCGVHTVTFTGNSQTFYLEGRRSIGLEIISLMEAVDPRLYPKLLLTMQKGESDG